MTLDELGWAQFRAKVGSEVEVDPTCVARVVAENKTNYTLQGVHGEHMGVLRGKALADLDAYSKPKVGDWVVCAGQEQGDIVAIEFILPRYALLRRHAAGEHAGVQVLVTNVDHVFVVQGLDNNFNLNRLERYLVMVEDSGAKPFVILNKADLVDDPSEYIRRVEEVAPHVPVLALSSLTDEAVHTLMPHLVPQSTSVFVGSSGAGKSTLLNRLLAKEVQETQTLRDDDQGRHTTTRRELFRLHNGALIIDTPGMRELSVTGLDGLASATESFADMDELTEECMFHDCDHEQSKGCALLAAVASGELDAERVQHYLKLQKEVAYRESQQDEERKRERDIAQRKLRTGYRKLSRELRKKRDSE